MADVRRLPFEYPPLMPDETLQGFVARIAGYYETGFTEYCGLVGLRVHDLLAGRQTAIRRLADMTGIDLSVLSHHAFAPLKRKLVAYRGQVLEGAVLRRRRLHGCPACLQEDVAASTSAMDAAAWIRGAWFVRAVRTCPVHRLGFVTLSSVQGHQSEPIFDTVERLRPILGDLRRLVGSAPVRRPSGLETYVTDRLEGRAFGTELLDRMPLHAAIRTCEALGAVALFGPKTRFGPIDDDGWRVAGAAGFDLVSAGPGGVRSLLAALQKQHRYVGTHNGKARNIYGSLYDWANKMATGPEYSEIRHILREHILDTMPVEAGRVLLGTAVDRQRVHSVLTACHDGRRLSVRLSRELVTVGLLPHGLAGDRQVTVDRPIEDLDAMRSRLAAALSRTQAAARLLVTLPQFQRLTDAGLVRPIVAGDPARRTRQRFAIDDLDDFAREVDRVAPVVPCAPAGMVALSEVALAATVGIVTILRHLFAGRLRGASRSPGATGYPSILIDPEEFRRVDLASQGDPSLGEAARRMQVGVRVPSMLVKAGHLRMVEVPDAGTCRRRRFVSAESFRAFTSGMASLVELSNTHGVHRTTLKGLFEREGVGPVLSKGEMGANFYRRSDVEAAARVRGRPWSV